MSDYEKLINGITKTTESIKNMKVYAQTEDLKNSIYMFNEKKAEFIKKVPLIKDLTDEEIANIMVLLRIERADIATTGDNANDWLFFTDKLEVYKNIYEVIKGKVEYQKKLDELFPLYKQELNTKLYRQHKENGSWKSYYAPYSEMREYSLVLAEICVNQIKKAYDVGIKSGNFIVPERALEIYDDIKTDMNKVGINMDCQYEEVINKMKSIKKVNEQRSKHLDEQKKAVLKDATNKLENKKQQLQSKIELIDKLIKDNRELSNAFSCAQHHHDNEIYARLKKSIINHEENRLNVEKISYEISYYEEMLQCIDDFYNLCNKIIVEQAQEKKAEQEKKALALKEKAELPQKINELEIKNNQMVINIHSIIDSLNKLIEGNNFLKYEIPNYHEYSELKTRFLRFTPAHNDDLKSKFNNLSYAMEFYQEVQTKFEQFYNECNQIIKKEKIEQERTIQKHQERKEQFKKTQEKSKLVDDLIDAIFKADELKGAGLNISQEEIKKDIAAIKRGVVAARKKLMDQDMGVLKHLLSRYTPQKELVSIDNTNNQFQQIKKEELVNKQLQTKSVINRTQQNINYTKVEAQEKSKIIADIIEAMMLNGDFPSCGIDISKRLEDMDYAKSKLESKSLEELKRILSIYAPSEEIHSTGGMKM